MKEYTRDELQKYLERLEIWSKELPLDCADEEPAAVNYHWGKHAGMVDRSKEVLPYFQYLINLVQEMEQELDLATVGHQTNHLI